MQNQQCACGTCGKCGSCGQRREAGFEIMEFGRRQRRGGGAALAVSRRHVLPFGDAEEMELVMELMEVSSEEEMDQFLGKMFKGIWKGVKKVGSVVGKIAKPLAGALKGIAKKALPFVGGALGSMIPIPGVGTALGSALGGALSKALELEFGNLEFEQQEFEMARRFVRVAGSAARNAADGDGSPQQLHGALVEALQAHAPQLVLPGRAPSTAMPPAPRQPGGQGELDGAAGPAASGRWQRRGNRIVVMGG